MAILFHNQLKESVSTNGPRIFQGPENVTNKILHLVPRKTIATELNVSESMIAKWIANEKPIPADRMFEIVKAGKAFCREVGEFESEIDMMVYLQFGKNPRGRE